MDFDAFKKLNIETLYFDNAANATPAQRVNPPTKAAAIPAPSAGYNKRGRGAQPAEWVSEFNPAISFSPNARLIDEVRNQGLGPKLVGKQTIHFYYVDYHRIFLGPDSKNGATPVLRCRTPFEYAGQTPYMNDKPCLLRAFLLFIYGAQYGSSHMGAIWPPPKTFLLFIYGSNIWRCVSHICFFFVWERSSPICLYFHIS